MTDEEMGSWWQQVTGEAILGPLKGRKLARMPFEQVSLASWAAENPDCSVLAAQEEYAELYGSNVLERGEDRDGEFMDFPVGADPLYTAGQF